ncbi:hypothetical protein VSWAT3_17983 [Vibrionales bacterium SWAT-3]|nr:hypothetical protein VSWAT3_17983 [Vibrionales bacterium SWAT-3]
MLSKEESYTEATIHHFLLAYYLSTYYLMTSTKEETNDEFMNKCNKKHILLLQLFGQTTSINKQPPPVLD